MSDADSSSSPPVTDQMRRAARAQPGSWIYVIDPAFDPNGEVPPEGIVGAYPVDEAGEIGDPFAPNPRYRPTPRGLRLPDPTDRLDALLQEVATGWAAEGQLLAELVDGPVWLLAGPAKQVFVAEDPDGRRVVWLFTDPVHAEQSVGDHELQEMTAPEILEVVPADVDLVVNPGSAVHVRIPCADFEGAVRANQ